MVELYTYVHGHFVEVIAGRHLMQSHADGADTVVHLCDGAKTLVAYARPSNHTPERKRVIVRR